MSETPTPAEVALEAFRKAKSLAQEDELSDESVPTHFVHLPPPPIQEKETPE